MDVLSIEGFKILAFVLALVVGAGVYVGFFRKWYWALVGAAFTFVVTTAGVGLYILLHVTDPRWSGGQEPFIQAPKVSETPLIGQYLEPLGTFLNQTASSINDAVAFQHALPVAWEFFSLSLFGLVVFVSAMIVALVMSKLQSLLLEKKVIELQRQNNSQKGQIGELTQAVNELRAGQGLPPLE